MFLATTGEHEAFEPPCVIGLYETYPDAATAIRKWLVRTYPLGWWTDDAPKPCNQMSGQGTEVRTWCFLGIREPGYGVSAYIIEMP